MLNWQEHWFIITHLLWIAFCIFLLSATLLGFYLKRYRKTERDAEVAARNPSMITNQFFREYWYWLVGPIIRLLIRMRFTPDGVSRLSLLVAIGPGLSYAYGHISTAGWLLLTSGGLDTMDGQIARETGIASSAGAFYDSVIDRYADFFVFAGIILRFTIMDDYLNIQNPSPGEINVYLVLLTLLCMLAANLISYSKERGVNLGAETQSTGLMQRADRVTVLGVASILDPLVIVSLRAMTGEILVHYHYVFGAGLAMIALLGNHTALRRIRRIRRDLAQQS